jgi:hypothetical protein
MESVTVSIEVLGISKYLQWSIYGIHSKLNIINPILRVRTSSY